MKNIKDLLSRFWKAFTYNFDRSASGTVFKKFIFLTILFISLYLIWLGIFTVFFNNQKGKINKDIPNDNWAIISQMIDPGNQHMIGDVFSTNKDSISANQKKSDRVVNKDCSDSPDPSLFDPNLRLLVLLISISGTFVFSGLLISTFTNIYERRVTTVREGMMNYFYKNHTVILGYNKIANGLITQILSKPDFGKRKVILMTSQSVPEVKRLLVSRFSKNEMRNIHVLYGDRTKTCDLNRLWLHQAKELFVLGEDNESNHDSKNNLCLVETEKLLKDTYSKVYNRTKKYPKILECSILFESQTTYVAHQFFNFQRLNENGKRIDTPLNINVFNFNEKWAQKVFVGCKHDKIEYYPLDFEPIAKDSNKYVHVIVAGMTPMGIAIGIQATRLGHFANFERKKTRITYIDSNADIEMNYFASRYQSFYEAVNVTYTDLINGFDNFRKGVLDFINVELCFVKGHFESPEVRKKILEWTSDTDSLTTIAICFNNPSVNLAAGLYLPSEVYKRKVNFLIQQETENSILSLLYEDEKNFNNIYKNVKAFGMIDDCVDLDLHSDFKAKAINYFYSSDNALPNTFSKETIQQMDEFWNGLRERYKWSSRYNADSINTKLRALNVYKEQGIDLPLIFNTENVELLAKIEHARWNVDALLTGYCAPSKVIYEESMRTADLLWSNYLETGLFDDSLKKTHVSYTNAQKREMIHPCLLPYDKLSEYYKDIDRRLVSFIPTIEAEFELRKKKS